jgi:DNA mismatch repair protein MutS2
MDVLDLDRETREALEFDALLDLVASHARTPMGARRLRAMRPQAGAEAPGLELSTVEELRGLLAEEGRLVTGALPDPAGALEALAIERARLDPRTLRDLATTLHAASELGRRLRRLGAETRPRLRELGGGLPDLGAETAAVLRCVDSDGRLVDDASPELRRIRTAIARVGERLRRTLEERVRDPGADGVIRDDFVTQRNGRFVIPVRTDSPRPVRGIVHASSSSGATLFVEPMESVGMNNELVALREEELEEQERILQDWALRFRRRLGDAGHAVETLAVVDDLQARALFADSAGAERPVLEPDGRLELRAVRHPLLDHKLREQGAACVPLDVVLERGERVLLLSGPNTGGKTVALKTIGLAVLMAQSGIPVTAARATLPTFRQVRADIGDHQSIDADLSTFSAHLKAASTFIERLEPPALLLFDEPGTGTEPGEGAALARSILESLLRPRVRTVATTHHGALKAWAFTTPGVVSAAMEFDAESLRPTFRVIPGAAGVSAGLDIAQRLGLDRAIVARARSYLGDDASRANAYLERLRELTAELERRGESLQRRQAELQALQQGMRERDAREREQRARETQRTLDRELARFRKQSLRELEGVRDARARTRVEKRRRKGEERLRSEAARAVRGAVGPAASETAGGPPVGELRPGMRVHVGSLGREGEVLGVRGSKVELRLGNVTLSADRNDLFGVADGAAGAGEAGTRPAGGGSSPLRRVDVAAPPREVKLVGLTVDEALPLLDKGLDSAALAGCREVRVVHGHGTGRLRAAVRDFLRGHPHVEAQRPGQAVEGGDGATVVRLR